MAAQKGLVLAIAGGLVRNGSGAESTGRRAPQDPTAQQTRGMNMHSQVPSHHLTSDTTCANYFEDLGASIQH